MSPQEKIVMRYLKKHKRGMTARDAQVLGVDRLSARIFNLRADGHVIDTEMEKNANGIGSHGRYFLIKEKK